MTDEDTVGFDEEGRYVAQTGAVTVRVRPQYDDFRAKPERGAYLWLYHVLIENEGPDTVQLISRHWRITDANGQQQAVDGPGVVGEQPILQPGDSFSYTSGCPLTTSSGMMRGHYVMASADQGEFPVTIPPFSLDIPDERGPMN